MTRRRRRLSDVQAGLLVLALGALVLALVLVQRGGAPHQRIQAVVSHTAGLEEGSPVRVAGVDVGEVAAVREGPDGEDTVVVLELDEDAPRVRRDATLKIRPRLVLEGGFFADLRPGSPGERELAEDERLPRTRTAVAVQLDEVLGTLQADPRDHLRTALRGWGSALGSPPTSAEDRAAAPEARGEDAATSLNDALRDAGPALRDSAVAAEALRGRAGGDATRLVAGLERAAGGLTRDRARLASLVEHFDATVAALAERRAELRTAVAELPGTLRTTDRALGRLRRALPPLRAVSRAAVPGLREVPATVAQLRPLNAQLRLLMAPEELGGTAEWLRPVARDLTAIARTGTGLLEGAGRLARCTSRVLVPTARLRVDDGPLSSGTENYKELLHGAVGFAGEGQNFDGNGTYIRFQPGGGPTTVAIRPGPGGGDTFFGHAPLPPLGTRPGYPGRAPRTDASRRCETQAVPDLTAPAGPPDGAGP